MALKYLAKIIVEGKNYQIEPWLYLIGSKKDKLAKAKDLLVKYNDLKIIIDLEDGLNFKEDYQKEIQLKDLARQNVSEFIQTMTENKNRIYLRINDANSSHYKNDFSFLVKNHHQIQGIILPKCESAEDMEPSLKLGLEVIPLVETRTGIKHLNLILAKTPKRFRFGHQDFFKRANLFPLPVSPFNHYRFNKYLLYLLKMGTKHHVSLMAPVYANLIDLARFRSSLKYFIQLCIPGQAVGLTALNLEQLNLIRELKNEIWEPVSPRFYEYTNAKKFSIAIKNIETYQTNKGELSSMTIMRGSTKGRFVSPHDFEVSVEFIEKLKKENPQLYQSLQRGFIENQTLPEESDG